MSARSLVVSATVLAAMALAPTTASAFCRTWTCDPRERACPPDPLSPKDCPNGGVDGQDKRLFWPQRCIGFSLQEDTTTKLPGATPELRYKLMETITDAAFKSWAKADCGGGTHPSIELYDLGAVSCSRHEYNKEQGNANIVVFRKGDWPYPGAANVLALTTVTFNVDSGEIYDADIELNDKITFSVGDAAVTNDLLATVTHEVGHFLGLAHSSVPGATMNAEYELGDTYQRDLSSDDSAGICSVYPPNRVNLPECNPEPRHGYATECATTVDVEKRSKATCSTAAPADGTVSGLVGLCLVAAALGRRRGRPSA